MAEKWALADETATPESFLRKSQLKNYNTFELGDENTSPEELFRPKNYLEEGVRHLGRTVARGTESILGIPGSVSEGILGLANAGISKLTGKPGPLPEKVNLTPILGGPVVAAAHYGSKLLGKESPFPEINLPNSEDVKENFTKKVTRNLLEPQSPKEETYDEVISDAAPILLSSLLGGAKTAYDVGKAGLRATGISAAGNTAKWAAETITGSPLIGQGVKVGTMIVAGTAGGRKELNKIKDAKYKTAFENLPPYATFNFSNALKKIKQIGKQYSKGDNPDKSFIADRVKAFEDLIEKSVPSSSRSTGILDQYGKPITKSVAGKIGGKANIRDATDIVKGWNQHLSDTKIPEVAKNALTRLVGAANEGIDKYGKTNPKFWEDWKIAKELHGAMVGTNYIQNIINKSPLLQDTIKNPVVKHLLYGGIAKGIYNTSVPKVAAGASAVVAAKNISKTAQLLLKSPYAQKAYGEWLLAGFKDNIPAMAKSAAKLNYYADKLI